MTKPKDDLSRVWLALPADGVMKAETVYGWITDKHIQDWRDEGAVDDYGDPLVYAEYVPAAELIAARAKIAALEEFERAGWRTTDAMAEALGPFAAMADQVDRWQDGTDPTFDGAFNADDLRRARSVLASYGGAA